ncbi:MAG TPA: TonB family protein [Candidatus Sulfotelmatobacter sp.]|nr:TonB family protein [Candidatus Sulfotelmatobacter sp.]
MYELSQKRAIGNPQARTAVGNQQPRKLLLALILLVVALVAVLITDRDFWFGAEQSTIESDVVEPTAAPQNTAKFAARPTQKSSKTAAAKAVPAVSATAEAKPATTPVVTANRVVLPPLDIEVIAGDTHHRVHPGSNALQISNAPASSVETNAAERQQLAVATEQRASLRTTYPMLAEHMNVQGAVVLQALIGADGVVENLRVLSGPSILASAAQQAVREWRFKPVLQNGQAVETKATITVNFTIKVNDDLPKTSAAGF